MAQRRLPYELWLRPIPWAATCAIVDGTRLAGWAEDFPAAGDVAIARILHLAGAPGAQDDVRWGRQQVLDSAGCVVGNAGFLGPPVEGEVEIAYGVVPSRCGRGVATRVVALLLRAAWDEPSVRAVLARTAPGNLASRRVLERSGFRPVPSGADACYRLDRTPSGSSSSGGRAALDISRGAVSEE